MKRLRLYVMLAFACTLFGARADEGMWLLQMMEEQYLVDQMKRQGLQLEGTDLYNPAGSSIKDAIGIFGGGCTGEIVSPEGLILTNHHCGYGAIQQHSSVEHDYLTNGFWAMSRAEELPTPGLEFTFVEKIVDVTEKVNALIASDSITEAEALSYQFLGEMASEELKASEYDGKPGIEALIRPFYAGNRYYLFFLKVYSDVRMVAAPPSSVGKFGGETDNWMWPRHTGDFSMFRIYADAEGNPALYSKDNVPLKTPKHLSVSIKGLSEGDYAMVMGFPGSTQRFLTRSEIQHRMDCQNTPRIQVREARQEVLKKEMAASDKVRIQYAGKYASSSNYWKNSIGMNKAIVDNKVREAKTEQEARFARFAAEKGNNDYATVVAKIDEFMTKTSADAYLRMAFTETFMMGIEFGAPYRVMDSLKVAVKSKNKEAIAKWSDELCKSYAQVHNKDYDHEVDRKVAKALFALYKEMNIELPAFYETIEKDYKGNIDHYIDDMYDNSITSNEKNLEKFLKKPSAKAIDKDLATAFSRCKWEMYTRINAATAATRDELQLLHKTYVRGLCEMYAPTPKAPDANFTLRLTYGTVKPYSPKNGVNYDYYTTLEGVMEKEDATNPEFVVPEKLKQLYAAKDYGRYALSDGRLPVNFITTNDITGGNSGSPVMNAYGELIGAAFDGNWESLSGDINFDNDKQRCIVVDIRYVLFILEKLGGCRHLVDEMTIVE
ncbi:MAG: S46 family peptidase [Bacteroidaceae bacterium]|nr:S46 family peptidase [Bacteroidaceae bacterium]